MALEVSLRGLLLVEAIFWYASHPACAYHLLSHYNVLMYKQPKTKGFARIRAALAEETTPIDSEVRREAEVIRQVRESDMDLEPRM